MHVCGRLCMFGATHGHGLLSGRALCAGTMVALFARIYYDGCDTTVVCVGVFCQGFTGDSLHSGKWDWRGW